ncbi:MAG TPA: aspartate--tRNA ligase [Clostridiales bacterium]|jgi:aspartyl-tRNA synthetase|nr:aspartate--tRNA ligase [Clostridiales bacterium]HCG36480.1 aspartate--tRNA ligase [Clostridiales bacterium]
MERTQYCADVRESLIGKKVCVCGWVQRQRNLGRLIFIDLRDRSGIVQLAFDETTDTSVFSVAAEARSEFVLCAKGVVRERDSKNPAIPTGNIEVYVDDLKILGKSQTPPFEIVENSAANEELRLKYRYLDLRRPDLLSNLLMRHKLVKITRDYFDENGFIEIETPMLIKSTPEGARDYLVPSRIHPGSFYALPQSPQLYKQLSMVAGFDRYMQIARCFRDEDLRADRQPEFTQIDLEMSFVTMEDVLSMVEGYMERVFRALLHLPLSLPLPRLTYAEAINRYGSDKPDTRYGLEIQNISDLCKDCGFSVFADTVAAGGSVRAICAPGGAEKFSRKEYDKLTEKLKGIGAKGLAYARWMPEGLTASFSKFVTPAWLEALARETGAKPGDAILILTDTNHSKLLSYMGALRTELSLRLGVEKKGFNLLWIVEIPFFERDEDTGEWMAMHHPFTSPLDECLPYLETDKANVRAKAYDLVLNGIELSSGSIRITDPVLQNRMFNLLGLSDEEARSKFGFLLDAFRYGAPPHGGMGIGLDRLCMQLLGCESLREVIAFPKVQNASELMTSCPAPVPQKALDDLNIAIQKKHT